MIKSDAVWAAWIAGGLVTFTAIEIVAIRQYPDPRHTLTAVTRRWLGVYPERPRRAASTAGLAGMLSVFAAHMLVNPPINRRYEDPYPWTLTRGDAQPALN